MGGTAFRLHQTLLLKSMEKKEIVSKIFCFE